MRRDDEGPPAAPPAPAPLDDELLDEELAPPAPLDDDTPDDDPLAAEEEPLDDDAPGPRPDEVEVDVEVEVVLALPLAAPPLPAGASPIAPIEHAAREDSESKAAGSERRVGRTPRPQQASCRARSP